MIILLSLEMSMTFSAWWVVFFPRIFHCPQWTCVVGTALTLSVLGAQLKSISDVDLEARRAGLSATSDDEDQLASTAAKNTSNDVLRTFFEKHVPAFGQLEMGALRLASLRRDPQLAQAVVDFRNGDGDSASFQKSLLGVVENIVQEADKDGASRL